MGITSTRRYRKLYSKIIHFENQYWLQVVALNAQPPGQFPTPSYFLFWHFMYFRDVRMVQDLLRRCSKLLQLFFTLEYWEETVSISVLWF